ncbi:MULTISPECIES: DUF3293 domain-containing protein [unclassified Thioalkalivibrio]|uniref:DUF3293 domain-containing protein n=1 Tax=unclassified Thioalkalivibrio TaxID=2621013 RepID=UPI000380FB56|nr:MULTISPECIES: DUF3293 domain-containing protein [unclassified Thioalkalivibrio]
MPVNTRGEDVRKPAQCGKSHPDPTPPAELEPAYRAADYCLETGDGFHVLHIDRPAEQTVAWMTARGAQRLVLFTACNPGSRPLTEEGNRRRQQRLERAVTEQGLRAWPARNRDPKGQWPDEPGLAIADLPDDLLARWLEAFGQNAAVLLEPPAPPRLVWRAGLAGPPMPPPVDAD